MVTGRYVPDQCVREHCVWEFLSLPRGKDVSHVSGLLRPQGTRVTQAFVNNFCDYGTHRL